MRFLIVNTNTKKEIGRKIVRTAHEPRCEGIVAEMFPVGREKLLPPHGIRTYLLYMVYRMPSTSAVVTFGKFSAMYAGASMPSAKVAAVA